MNLGMIYMPKQGTEKKCRKTFEVSHTQYSIQLGIVYSSMNHLLQFGDYNNIKPHAARASKINTTSTLKN